MVTARVTRRPIEARAIELILSVRWAGFSDAVRHYHPFIDLTLGHSALDAAALSQPSAAREADRNAWRENYRQLSPDTHPNIAATARHLAGHRSGSSFETTMELFPAALVSRKSLTMG